MSENKRDTRVVELKDNLAKLHVLLMMIPLIKDKLTPEQRAELKTKLQILQDKVDAFRAKLDVAKEG